MEVITLPDLRKDLHRLSVQAGGFEGLDVASGTSVGCSRPRERSSQQERHDGRKRPAPFRSHSDPWISPPIEVIR